MGVPSDRPNWLRACGVDVSPGVSPQPRAHLTMMVDFLTVLLMYPTTVSGTVLI
ncbi:hypothetical protein STEG23_021148, partial [Scotinomys teguina]